MGYLKQGQKALVTGASRGLGKAIAEKLIEKGIQVWGTSRNPSNVNWIQGVQPVRLDLSSPEAIEECWAKAGLDQIEFDVVINNAGSGFHGEFAANHFEDWDSQIAVLLRGTMKICRLAIDGLVSRGRGVLVNVSSGAVLYPVPFMSGYNASKAGLSAFSQSLMTELKPYGVHVIDFQPFDMDTGFNDTAIRGKFTEPAKEAGDRAWNAMVANCQAEGPPDAIATKLLASIDRNRSRTVRAGGFFQSVLSPLFARFSPMSLQRAFNERYYKL